MNWKKLIAAALITVGAGMGLYFGHSTIAANVAIGAGCAMDPQNPACPQAAPAK